MSNELSNIDKCCRTCLTESSTDMVDIFGETNGYNVADILSFCTPIKIAKEDPLPEKLCYKCYDCLINFYNFRKLAVENDVKLNAQLNATRKETFPFKIEICDIKSESNIETIIDYDSTEQEFDEYKDEGRQLDLVIDNEDFTVSSAKLSCDICKKKYKQHSQLKRHMLKHASTHTDLNSFEQKTVFMEHNDETNAFLSELDQNENQNFQCDTCFVNFKSPNSLSAHKRVHTMKGRILACSHCGKVFRKLSHLKRHELIHDINRPFKCNSCLRSFISELLFKEHLNKHKGEKSNRCPVTSENTVKNKHLSAKFSCDICKKKYKTHSQLERHMFKHAPTHTNLNSFDQKTELMTHVMSHNDETNACLSELDQNENRNFKCDTCFVNFKSLNSLSAHKRVHTIKGRILVCSHCEKVFKKLSHLKRHELIHDINRPFKCNSCPKSFTSELLLREHLNKHNGVKSHTCPLCNKAFAHMSTLNTHIKTHKKEKHYLCSTCGKRFDSSNNLKQHLNRHLGLKLFACMLCPRKFVTKGELGSHNITHTGEKKHSCDECGATFTKNSSLRKHKLVHLGIKPHQCEKCQMRFTCKAHLKRHYRIHTGEKPYQCDICSRAFAQSNDLVKHKRAHLGDKLYKCDQCTESFRLKTELRFHLSKHFIASQMATLNISDGYKTSTDGGEVLSQEKNSKMNSVTTTSEVMGTKLE